MSTKFDTKNGYFYNLKKCLSINIVFYSIFFLVGILIGLITDNIYRSIFTLLFCTVFSYFSHSLSHKIFPLNFRYFHNLHHNDKHNKKLWAEIIEWLVNIFQIGGLILIPINYIIEKKFNITLLNNNLIIYYTLVYTTTHMINYHIVKEDTHVRHHHNTNTNFGPDYMDILFKTKQNNSYFEEMNQTIINSLISGCIIIFIIHKKNKF